VQAYWIHKWGNVIVNYIWEAALHADKERIPREKLKFRPVDNGSPYMEIVRENINEKMLGVPLVEVNPLYRFAHIFSELFSKNLKGYEQTREKFFEVSMQYMVQLDLRQGMDKQEYRLCFLLEDILNGVFGVEAAQAIRWFEKENLRQLLRFILDLYECGSSIYLFRKVMRYLYPDSIVYVNNEDTRQLLIYVGRKETETEQKKLAFLQGMFLPIYYEVFLFWEHHFGIIDVEETMELDNMVLF